MMEFNLSKKQYEEDWNSNEILYKESDIKEFIRLLKEELNDDTKFSDRQDFEEFLDKLAGINLV